VKKKLKATDMKCILSFFN